MLRLGSLQRSYGRDAENPKYFRKSFSMSNNTMWDVLIPTVAAAKALAGNVRITKSVRLQNEHMGQRKTKVTLHGVPFGLFFLPAWRSS